MSSWDSSFIYRYPSSASAPCFEDGGYGYLLDNQTLLNPELHSLSMIVSLALISFRRHRSERRKLSRVVSIDAV
jgi:hypothetical protein